jgi:DUF2075 family protein
MYLSDTHTAFHEGDNPVSLSRGMKGCYVHFMDKETEQFVRSRTESEKTAIT